MLNKYKYQQHVKQNQFINTLVLLSAYFNQLKQILKTHLNLIRSMSQIKVGQQPIDEEVRDNFFKEIRHKNNNNICLDCEKKNPKWASIHLGIHLCIDCAGKHRQYGVIYSFVKSTNLDVWNQKQLLFMQKGGNQRAIQYFRKCGIISNNNKHIDYKSPVVQKYKTILTQEVESQLTGEPIKKIEKIEKKEQIKQHKNIGIQLGAQTKQIPHAEEVTQAQKPKKKKDKKKKMGNQIVIQNFEQLVFDDGVSKQQKDKIVKQYQKQESKPQQKIQSNNIQDLHSHQQVQKPIQPPKPQAKQLTQEESIKKLEQLKSKNLKQISSEQFKDTSIDNVTLKQKLNTFSGSTSISSSAFNDEPQQNSSQAIQKVKSFVTNTGGKLLSSLSSYWSK